MKKKFSQEQMENLGKANDNDSMSVRLLREAMIFWHKEGPELIENLIQQLEREGAGREVVKIDKLFSDRRDKWIKIANALLEYETPRLSRVDIATKKETSYVIRGDNSKPQASSAWAERVEKEKEQKLIEYSSNMEQELNNE